MNGSGIARPAEEAGKRPWETKNRYRGLSSRQVRVVSFFFTPALSVAVGATIPDTGTAGHPHYISFAQKYGLRNEERVKSKG
jgi:hypothetical protein